MIEANREHFIDAASRVKIGHMSCQRVAEAARAFGLDQDPTSPAGLTLMNLMTGFADAIERQSGCV